MYAPTPGVPTPPRATSSRLPLTPALLLVISLLSACGEERFPVVQVQPTELVHTIVASGRVVPPARVHLGATRLGTVAQADCEPGRTVAAGDLLVTLDDAELAASVRSAEASWGQTRHELAALQQVDAPTARAQLAQTQANLEKAQADDRRAAALADSGVVTPAEREASSRDLAVAEAQHRAAEVRVEDLAQGGAAVERARLRVLDAEAALDAARARLAQTRITAPGAGVVLACDADPGDIVQPGTGLVELAVGGATEVEVAVDERNLAGLRVGQPARVVADAFPGQPLVAHVLRIAPAVDPARGTVDVRLALDGPVPFARVDMTVTAEVEVARDVRALLVPSGAVLTPEEAPHVFVVEDGHARRREVRPDPGSRTDGGDGAVRWNIQAGLATGDLVLVPAEGQAPPVDGEAVRPRSEG